MISQDYEMLIYLMGKRMDELEEKVSKFEAKPDFKDHDWDNATLMQEWKICERTAAYYRKNGLEYYKRAGRVYYSAEARDAFQKQSKTIN